MAILGVLWGHFEGILLNLWEYSGDTLRTHQGYSWDTMGGTLDTFDVPRRHFGGTLKVLFVHLRVTLSSLSAFKLLTEVTPVGFWFCS